MHRHARLTAQRHDLGNGLQDSHLVVAKLAVHDGGAVGGEAALQVLEAKQAPRFHADLDETTRSPARLTDTGVLHSGTQERAAGTQRGGAEHGGIGSFSGTAREHDA
jgi:hypothetical protein